MTENEARKLKLSEHFTLWEFLYSDTAMKHGLMGKQLEISSEHVYNLKRLCDNVLEPLRLKFGVVVVTSGYRCKELNRIVGSSPTSQHTVGEAADVTVSKGNREAFEWLAKNVVFDQLIDEYNFSWVHVSHKAANNRFMLLKIDSGGTKRMTIK